MNLYCFLTELIENNYNTFQDLGLMSNEVPDHPKICIELTVDEMSGKWPGGLYNVLDRLNEERLLKRNIDIDIIDGNEIILSPIYAVHNISNILKENGFFRKILLKYLVDRYNIQYFRAVLEGIIIDNEYIGIEHAGRIFNIAPECIQESFMVKVINGEGYIDYKDIINLISLLLNCAKGYRQKNDGYKNFNLFYRDIKKYKVKYIEIIKLLISGEIPLKVNIYEAGMKMFCVPYEDSRSNLIKLIMGGYFNK